MRYIVAAWCLAAASGRPAAATDLAQLARDTQGLVDVFEAAKVDLAGVEDPSCEQMCSGTRTAFMAHLCETVCWIHDCDDLSLDLEQLQMPGYVDADSSHYSDVAYDQGDANEFGADANVHGEAATGGDDPALYDEPEEAEEAEEAADAALYDEPEEPTDADFDADENETQNSAANWLFGSHTLQKTHGARRIRRELTE